MKDKSKFNLLRYFSITSAIFVLVATVALTITLRQISVNDLIRTAEHQNVSLAQSIANQIWPQIGNYVRLVDLRSQADLLARQETQEIHQALKTMATTLPVLKVKIYNLAGLTIYSSQQDQIGEDKSQNPGFNFVTQNERPASKMSARNSFSAFSGTVHDLDLVESYLPIFGADGTMEGVFELYADVSPLVARIDSSLSVYPRMTKRVE